ncbi:MAG TPA: crosslink repair DNA glycosylase YcaQ family protein, partial [Solirubrobacteraceae bacterium]|nr:crosslink repair DNA glycosylase YcaQ family protein [Solirubrobacteraceae bacterium]
MSLARQRAAAQLLDGGGPRDPADVVRHLLAVQAQDARAWPLALRARGVPAAGDSSDLGAREDLVIAWLLRGTLHLVAAEDLGWLLALTGHPVTRRSARRLHALGVDRGD